MASASSSGVASGSNAALTASATPIMPNFSVCVASCMARIPVVATAAAGTICCAAAATPARMPGSAPTAACAWIAVAPNRATLAPPEASDDVRPRRLRATRSVSMSTSMSMSSAPACAVRITVFRSWRTLASVAGTLSAARMASGSTVWPALTAFTTRSRSRVAARIAARWFTAASSVTVSALCCADAMTRSRSRSSCRSAAVWSSTALTSRSDMSACAARNTRSRSRSRSGSVRVALTRRSTSAVDAMPTPFPAGCVPPEPSFRSRRRPTRRLHQRGRRSPAHRI